MKWIKIVDAKVKFNTAYLVAHTSANSPHVATLAEIKQTSGGLTHSFVDNNDGTVILTATHIAIITDPTKD